MNKFLILIIILISSTLFADVYLKTVYEPRTPTILIPKDPIVNLCPGDNDYWSTSLLKCVCDRRYKESPTGCIIDPCYKYSCGNDGVCETTLIKDRVRYPDPITYHYEASCTCPENYVEFNVSCIENPCLDYDCLDYGYCGAVEDTCECKDGYVEYIGDNLFHVSTPYETPAEDVLTCIGTEKVWDWTVSDKECESNDGTINIWYAFYSDEVFDLIASDKHCNALDNCRCIESPFTQSVSANTTLEKADFYSKDNGWRLLYKGFGYPLFRLNEGDIILGKPNVSTIQPKFILYNKYTGEVKTFIYLRNHLVPKSYGFLSIFHKLGDISSKSMLFNNVFSKSLSEGYYKDLEKYSIDIAKEFSTKTIVPKLPALSGAEFWFYGDFVSDYDSNTKNLVNSLIDFDLIAVDELKLTGNIVGTLTERVNNGTSSIGIGDVFSKFNTAKGYYKSVESIANKYLSTANEIETSSELGSGSTNGVALATNTIIALGGSTIAIDILRNTIPVLGAAVAFLDFFIGSEKQSMPTVFQARLEVDLEGIHNTPLEAFSLKTPGTKYEKNPSLIEHPFYDKPLGVVSLLSPPIIEYEDYHSCIPQDGKEELLACIDNHSFEYECNPNEGNIGANCEYIFISKYCDEYNKVTCNSAIDYYSTIIDDPNGDPYDDYAEKIRVLNVKPEYDHYNYYKLTKLPEIGINPDSGLELVSANVSIIGEVDFMNEYSKLESNWNEIREAGGRDSIYSYKVNDEIIQNQTTGNITNIISKYSTRVLPYDVAENELSLVFPKRSSISIKVVYTLKTKGTESTNKTFLIIKTYRPDIIKFEEKISNSSELLISETQKYGAPIGNIVIRDLQGNTINKTLKKGQEIELSYSRIVNNLTSARDTSILYPYEAINITMINQTNSFDLLFTDGDQWSWYLSSKISSYYNLSDELDAEYCTDTDISFNCILKKSLKENIENDLVVYNIIRNFKVPTSIVSGKYTLSIPIKYYIYRKESDYIEELRFYNYKKEIEIIE